MAARVQFLVVVALLTIGCGISEAPSTSPIEGSALTASGRPVAAVEAEGGRASLALPLGALPAGVSEKDVAVTVSFVTVPAIQPGEIRGLAVVELSPDGVQLTAPATLTLTFPPGTLTDTPLVVHQSGDQATLITEVAVELDAKSGQMRTSVSVHHFSQLRWYESGREVNYLLNTSAMVVTNHYQVGDSFDITLKVARFNGSMAHFIDSLTVGRSFILTPGEPLPDSGKKAIWQYLMVDGPWELEGKLMANGDLVPALASNLPPKARMGASDSYTGSTRLTCVRPGGGLFQYHATITFTMAERIILGDGRVLDGGRRTQTGLGYDLGPAIFCDAPRISAALAAPFTTYTIIPGISTGLSSVHYAWSGANCGSVTGSTTAQLVWNHGEDNCDHSSVNHDDATISLLISGVVTTTGDKVELRCLYQSAVSGRGSPCVQEPGGRQ